MKLWEIQARADLYHWINNKGGQEKVGSHERRVFIAGYEAAWERTRGLDKTDEKKVEEFLEYALDDRIDVLSVLKRLLARRADDALEKEDKEEIEEEVDMCPACGRNEEGHDECPMNPGSTCPCCLICRDGCATDAEIYRDQRPG